MVMLAPIPSRSNSEPVVVERQTRGGRHLFYRLEVIQQPERARACGSGPKSSADRRPVDPPPVVELRIFEGGPTIEQSKDITFLYNANFFLYATLEHARVMAHGRLHNTAANAPPVLTGMPVSGMAYLDRPQEAGYFLFPDLSVRHEGRYRLTFSLYEQAKEEKDKDLEKTDKNGLDAGDSFDWRMEIKSNDFIVFSAKKFPGLTESTALSRTVAEQGCRVRIRRDVRMRRRDGKGTGDYENTEDDYARRRRTQTPEVASQFRSRSMSSESVQRTPYQPEPPQRRPSGVDYPPPPPAFSGSQQPSGGHLSFGTHYSSQPYPTQNSHQPPSVPQSPSYAPSQQAYAPHQAPYPGPPQAPPHAPYQERPPSQYSAAAPSPQREAYPVDYRRSSTSTYGAPSTPHGHNIIEAEYRAEPPRQYTAPPPLVPATPTEPKPVSLPPLSTAFGNLPPSDNIVRQPLPSPSTERSSSYSYQYPSQTSLPGLGKRSWADANPVSAHSAYTYKNHSRQPEQTDEIENVDDLVWKRADGSHRRGDLPGQIL